MPIYIATVYYASSTALCVDGDAAIRRYIFRDEAESPEMFEAEVRDRYIHDVDALVEFGPVSLSKQQVTTHKIPVMEKD